MVRAPRPRLSRRDLPGHFHRGSKELLVAALTLSIPSIAYAQWDAHESVVVSTTGSELGGSMLPDGQGGAFLTWSEWVNGIGWRIFAQRVDSAGTLLWATGGVQVSSGSGYAPRLVPDASGGVFVLWRDWGLQAQRLSGTGQALWSAPVVVVSNDDYPVYGSAQTGDGVGGVIFVWDGPDHFTSDRTLFDLRAQRLAADGQLSWGPIPVTVVGTAGYQGGAEVIADDQGGAIIAFREEDATGEYDLRAQRIDAQGQALWTAGGVPLCEAVGLQEDLALHRDGSGGALALWKDRRAADSAIYGQRIDASGQAQWPTDGIALGGVSGSYVEFSSVSDGAGGFLLSWAGNTQVTGPRRAQRVDGSGTLLWDIPGPVLAGLDLAPTVARVAADGEGGAFFAWMDSRRGTCRDIYAQHLDASGAEVWPSNGVVVAALEQSRALFAIAAHDGARALVFWGASQVVSLPQRDALGAPALVTAPLVNPLGAVLSRVGAAGTGWSAECEKVSDAPPPERSIQLSVYPNPFNPRTTLRYEGTAPGPLRLEVFDLAGRSVRTLRAGWSVGGSGEVTWDGRDDHGDRVGSGTYAVRLRIGDQVVVRRVALLK